jgi:hypothetical protein
MEQAAQDETVAPEPQDEPSKPTGKKRFSLSSVLPIVAMSLSIFSLYESELARKEVARMDVIKTDYGLFHNLAQLQIQYPLMAHLFAVTGEAYDSNVEKIKAASSSASSEERSKLLLQERALAHYIFTTYEEAFYLWKQAEGGDRARAQLAQDDLLYFNDALRSNPRLLWYWDHKDGGKMDREFARNLRDYYQENVLKDCEYCTSSKDTSGPFTSERKATK